MANNKQPRRYFVDKGDHLRLSGKRLIGRRGSNIYTDSPQFFDHFMYTPGTFTTTGPCLANYATYTSTGTAVTNPTSLAVGAANVTGGAGGVLKFTTDDVQNSAEEWAGPLLYEADVHGPLLFEARVQIAGAASSTKHEAFFGLSDRTTATSGRPYSIAADSTITALNVPADFAGFALSIGTVTSGALFETSIEGAGTDGTKGAFIISNNATDTITAMSPEYVVDAAGTVGAINDATAWHVYRIYVGVDGRALFYVDGIYVGTGVIRTTIPLCPYFDVVTLDTSGANTSATMAIDYVFCGGASNWRT